MMVRRGKNRAAARARATISCGPRPTRGENEKKTRGESEPIQGRKLQEVAISKEMVEIVLAKVKIFFSDYGGA